MHPANHLFSVGETVELELSSPMTAVVMSLFAGLSTAVGAASVYCIKAGPLDPNIMSFSLSLAAGVMLTVSILELLPHGLKTIEGEGPHAASYAFACALAGALTYAVVSRLMPHVSSHALPYAEVEGKALTYEKSDDERQVSRIRAWRLALVLMISLTLHNLPEGFAVAVSAISSTNLGFVVMIAIMLHNIPEGIVIAVPAYAAHGSKHKAVMLAAASGFSEPIGALIAVLFLKDVTAHSLRYVLSYVGGMMCAVAMMELIPEALSCKKPFAFIAGLICGAAVIAITGYLIPV